jgi:hypothetical protein
MTGTATMYYSPSVRLWAAQEALNTHVTHVGYRWCAVCRCGWPCRSCDHASDLFTRYGRLPRRIPGRTRPLGPVVRTKKPMRMPIPVLRDRDGSALAGAAR